MNKCEKCGFLHYRTDPCRKPKKSTAALMEVRGDRVEELRRRGERHDDEAPTVGDQTKPRGRKVLGSQAGTQALPVDTNSLRNQNASSGNADGGKPLTQTSPAKFDRKAWMREYQRNYMRNVYRPKLKASKSNPNTPERNDK